MLDKTINGKDYLFAEVQEDANDWHFEWEEQSIFYYDDWGRQKQISLPDSRHYTIIGRASELNEDQWQGIARELPVGNRWENQGDYPIWFHTAKESGLCIVSSLGLKPETTLIIQKQ